MISGNTNYGVKVYNGRPSTVNCTIAFNKTGIYDSGVTTAQVVNTIMYFNSTTNYSGTALIFTNSCTTPLPPRGSGNITNAPLFVDTNAGNYRMVGESPGINAGLNQAWMLTAKDRDGTNARILYGKVDIGAYEYSTGTLSCTFSANPTWALAPSTNQFTAIVDGTNQDTLYYRWDFKADGTVVSNGLDMAVVTNVYSTSGYYSVALTVTNAIAQEARFTNLYYIKAGPVTLYVTTNGGNVFPLPYTNWAQAASNAIQTVLNAANDRDTVIVSNGTYVLSAQVSVNNGVLVQGFGGWSNTIVNGSGATRCFYLNHTNAALAGLTLSNGRALASSGGGVYFNKGSTVSNCVIRNCRADTFGGGVYLSSGGVLRNCLVVTNSALTNGGGGIYIYQTGLVQNCTIAGNVASNFGGGILCSNAGAAIQNSVIYSNFTGSTLDSNWYTNGGAVTFTNCCTTPTNGLVGTGNIANAPAFVNFAGDNFRLGSSSPCVNTGTNAAWMDTALDLLDRPRLYYGRVDIGCYEYYLDVKVNGIPIDRIKRINGVDKNRIIRIGS